MASGTIRHKGDKRKPGFYLFLSPWNFHSVYNSSRFTGCSCLTPFFCALDKLLDEVFGFPFDYLCLAWSPSFRHKFSLYLNSITSKPTATSEPALAISRLRILTLTVLVVGTLALTNE